MTDLSTLGEIAPVTAGSAPTPDIHVFGAFAEEGLSGAGYVRRAAAKVIDFIILNVAELVVSILFAVVVLVIATARETPSELVAARLGRVTFSSWILGVVAAVSYFTLFEWLWGTTPGKRLVGLVVIAEDMTRCSFLAALKRNLVLLLEMLCLSIPAALAINDSARAQRHGDRWAGTVVPRRESVGPALVGTPASLFLALLAVLSMIAVTMALTVCLKVLLP